MCGYVPIGGEPSGKDKEPAVIDDEEWATRQVCEWMIYHENFTGVVLVYELLHVIW